MIVLDANILVRAVLGDRVRELIERYLAQSVRFFTPDAAMKKAEYHLPGLMKKRGRPVIEALKGIEYIREFVEVVEEDLCCHFESDARQRMRGRDGEDWPVMATALSLRCAIWTEDQDFFGTGVPVWTTNRVQIFLDAQVASKPESP